MATQDLSVDLLNALENEGCKGKILSVGLSGQ